MPFLALVFTVLDLCIPGVNCNPPPCLPVITCPPPPLPIAGDKPPVLPDPPKATNQRTKPDGTHVVTLTWPPAKDDQGIVGYRLSRDGKLRATTGRHTTSATFAFPCGRHLFKVEAVDTAGQRDAQSLELRRKC